MYLELNCIACLCPLLADQIPMAVFCLSSPTGACSCTLGSSTGVITIEGPLRRKTLLKEGKKPTVSDFNSFSPYDSNSVAAAFIPKMKFKPAA